MTNEEFEIAQAEAILNIPSEFHQFLRENAWERGHSSGYEEVLGIIRNLADSLEPAIVSYRNRLFSEER